MFICKITESAEGNTTMVFSLVKCQILCLQFIRQIGSKMHSLMKRVTDSLNILETSGSARVLRYEE